MSKLIWDNPGKRYFEAGVDRGVLYTSNGVGVAWNGLIGVTESPSGGEPIAYYIDGVKYVNIANREEFSGTIEAFTYPDEFSEYDGSLEIGNGLTVYEQPRKSFSLSYRTFIGNDIDGSDHGYKIHIIYNALASPTEKSYMTFGENIDPTHFSWSITTKPVKAISNTSLTPLSHVVVDSTKTDATVMQYIESYLYGSSTVMPKLMPFEQLIGLFEVSSIVMWTIVSNPETGLNNLIPTSQGDLMLNESGEFNDGLYIATPNTRLVETQSGLYLLES